MEQKLTFDIETDVTVEEISDAIGEQLILDGIGKPFSYIAGLSLETMTKADYDIVDTMMEFFRNESTFDFEKGEVDTIEEILRDAYNR